ncbi:MAG TPA: hypothetical protein VEG30_13235 [Terriglobales bacterium]|nr:hypothetical protein [Terriglobales bacterium]
MAESSHVIGGGGLRTRSPDDVHRGAIFKVVTDEIRAIKFELSCPPDPSGDYYVIVQTEFNFR